MPRRKMITAEEWAELYNLQLRSVWRLIREKRIRAVNIGTQRKPQYRIPETEIARFDKENAA